jgi:hypothetical protein
MTELEWLECISPEEMLAFLGERASPRKKRLFACACVRRIWPLLTDESLRLAVKAAEQFADGKVSADVLAKARRKVKRLKTAPLLRRAVEAILPEKEPILLRPRDIREAPSVIDATRSARTAARALDARGEDDAPAPFEPIRPLAALDAVELVREIFGNPFRPVRIERNWLTWKDNLISRMARIIYGKRCFRNLPILADALEEAGCCEEELLSHCRKPVDHVRGCWAVDLCLGKS